MAEPLLVPAVHPLCNVDLPNARSVVMNFLCRNIEKSALAFLMTFDISIVQPLGGIEFPIVFLPQYWNLNKPVYARIKSLRLDDSESE